jgi:hypothetical protein
LKPDQDSGLGIAVGFEEACGCLTGYAKTMHKLHSFGIAGFGLEKPGCASAALAADWGKRHLSHMPDQPEQALPQ